MTLSPLLTSQVPEQPYVRLHVTLLSTTSPSIDPEYLNLPATATPPSMLLTTYEGARNGGKEPEFNSISYHGKISDDEWVVKVFSQERKSDEWLRKVFRGQVGWVHRKEVSRFAIALSSFIYHFLVGRLSCLATHNIIPSGKIRRRFLLYQRL